MENEEMTPSPSPSPRKKKGKRKMENPPAPSQPDVKISNRRDRTPPLSQAGRPLRRAVRKSPGKLLNFHGYFQYFLN